MYFSDIIYSIRQPFKDYVYMKKMIRKLNHDITDIENQRFIVKSRLARLGVAQFITIDKKAGIEDRFYSTFHAMDSMYGPWLAPHDIFYRINDFIIKQRFVE